MFKADKTVTVIRCTTDGATDQTSYTCRAFAGCSWYADHSARAERNGTAPFPTVKVRIPAEAIQAVEPGWTPQPGDLLVLGAAAVETEAELSALRKQSQTARVKAWHDHLEQTQKILQMPDPSEISSSSFRFGKARVFSSECPPTLPL